MSPVVLAYLGDAVYSLYVREKLAFENDFKSGRLHAIASKSVSASAQAELAARLLEVLTDEERDIFMRARNAKKATKSKNSSIADYNRSTGIEALIGFLYITGETDRLNYLLDFGDTYED